MKQIQSAAALLCLFLAGVIAAGASASAGVELTGRAIYEARCVECHGQEGKGNGPASTFLSPRPRDFTSGKYKFRSTATGSIPTDEDLMRSIGSGLHGTSMPEWRAFLSKDSLAAVASYVKTFSPRFLHETPKPIKNGPPVPGTAASVAAGEQVYRKLECASCHGTDGRCKDAIAAEFVDDWGNALSATNLSEPWTFRGGATPDDIYLRFMTGIDGTPMPSFAGSGSEREMRDLANYVITLGRKPAWTMTAEELTALYASLDKSAKANPVERGKYLVSSIGCAECHTPMRDDGTMMEEFTFAGGQRWDLFPFPNVVSYNLTSDKETGLGNWTDDQLKTFLTTGVRRNGSRMIPYPMPWPALALLTADDLSAIVAYLRTIPPVHNAIPEPASPGIFTYLWAKFRVLILKEDLPLRAYPGNAGTPAAKELSANESGASARKESQP